MTFFGRDKLIKKIVHLAEDLCPIALIGASGIGKTSIAQVILHHDKIKQRFGHGHCFIPCDKFPPSRAHFLRQLSNAVGAGVKKPKDLSPLRAFLSSKEMLIILDNAESMLNPQGTYGQEVYAVVEKLSRFSNLCVLITSRVSTIPPDYKLLDIPPLSMNAARDIFYLTYRDDSRSDLINGILKQLDLHPITIELLANVARSNGWTIEQLGREWEQMQASMLQTKHNSSLTTAIELSLASPLFRQLDSDARAVLEVIAFFPQGVHGRNIGWLFPTIPNRAEILYTFGVLSLTYWTRLSITMLAPLRDHLHPMGPKLPPLYA